MPDLNSSDSELMHAVKCDDTSALVLLIERWEARLLNFIFRYVQIESVARDLVQETFVKVYYARDRFDENKTFSTWMFSIASNLCRNHQRWVKRHAEAPMEDSTEPVDNLSPSVRTGQIEQQKLIAEAIASLPHALRLTVLFYYYEDLSYQEIARITGCSVRGVESRLYRARKLLSTKLSKHESINPVPSALRERERLPV